MRDIRSRDRLTLDEVALTARISDERLLQIENGQVDLEFEEIIALGYALRTDPGVLIGGVGALRGD